ncbi:hypothetical protein INR49_031204, partial [Caranx melampygus]
QWTEAGAALRCGDSGAAGWEHDAVRPSRRTDLTERNHSSILCFLELEVQVGRTSMVLVTEALGHGCGVGEQ